MDVKQAVQIAKSEILKLYEGENIQRIELEEVEFRDSDNVWLITIGFSRVYSGAGTILQGLGQIQRAYKIVHVDDQTGKVLAVKIRETVS